MNSKEKVTHGVLKNGGAFYPYWGKSFTTITGLDPLGLQTASEKIYSYLLPGITNLTNRIRYYGFYCWLLNKYIQLYDGRITQQSQRRFIRRSELLVALIMMKSEPNASQITGSRKAREILSEIGGNGTINLAKYADERLSEDAYWKYATGAFGQYYSASIRQIGLIREDMISNNHHVHMITEEGDFVTGLEIADAFNSSLDVHHIELFISVVEHGEVTIKQCMELYASFSMTDLPKESVEVDYYSKLLNDPDYPKSKKISTTNRSKTLSSLIKHIKSTGKGSNTEEYLADTFYNNCTDMKTSDDIEYFWYLYRVNEYWQYSLGTIFWATMNTLKDHGGALPKEELINSVTKKILDMANINSDDIVHQLFIDADINTLRETSDKIHSSVQENNSDKALSLSSHLLLSILGLSLDKIESDFSILVEKGLIHSECFWSDYLKMKVNKDFERKIEPFLKKLISTYVLNRHKQVALRKLGNGSRSSIKFSEERDIYFYKGNFSPSFTNPRIGTALNMLDDLGKIKSVGNFYKLDI